MNTTITIPYNDPIDLLERQDDMNILVTNFMNTRPDLKLESTFTSMNEKGVMFLNYTLSKKN
jgi:hypothetical protein